MILITKQQIIDAVPERWKRQYETNGTAEQKSAIRRLEISKSRGVLTEGLIALIIGNSSWTVMRCDECNTEVDALVQLGEPLDYDSQTAQICHDCLTKAAAMH